MAEYSIQWEDWIQKNEKCQELLAVVKEGDHVTYLGVYGEDDPTDKCDITSSWNNEYDRPQEWKPGNTQFIVFDIEQ